MYRQEFYIVAKKDDDIESPNYRKLLALRSDHNGAIADDEKWTDNIFLAKHFRNESDATLYASRQLNMNFIAKSYKYDIYDDKDTTDYKIAKVYIDIDGNSEMMSVLCTK